jgi:hypothetical protein
LALFSGAFFSCVFCAFSIWAAYLDDASELDRKIGLVLKQLEAKASPTTPLLSLWAITVRPRARQTVCV